MIRLTSSVQNTRRALPRRYNWIVLTFLCCGSIVSVISAADGAAHDLQREQGGVRLLHDPLQEPQDHRILHQASGGQVSQWQYQWWHRDSAVTMMTTQSTITMPHQFYWGQVRATTWHVSGPTRDTGAVLRCVVTARPLPGPILVSVFRGAPTLHPATLSILEHLA